MDQTRASPCVTCCVVVMHRCGAISAMGRGKGKDGIILLAENVVGRGTMQTTRMSLWDTHPSHPSATHLVQKIMGDPDAEPVHQ